MKILYEEPHFFTVSRNEENDEHYLEVLCGTSAVFTIRIKLTTEEIVKFKEKWANIRSIADQIYDYPESFKDRWM